VKHFFQIILPIILFSCLGVLHAQDSLNVSLVARLHHDWAPATDIAVSGDYAYVVTDYTGLRILDISNPERPVEVSSIIHEYAEPSQVIIHDTLALVLYEVAEEWRDAGLQIVDIRDPENPEELAFYSRWSRGLNTMVVIESLVYIAESRGELEIVNISDPENPEQVELYEFDEDYYFTDMEIVDSTLFLVGDRESLHMINISDPLNPVYSGILAGDTTLTGRRHIDGYHDYLYLTCFDNGLKILDISNPWNPVEVNSILLDGFVRDVTVLDNKLFVVITEEEWTDLNPCEIPIFSLTNPENPIEIGVIDQIQYINYPGPSIDISNDITFITYSGLRVIDISDISNTIEIGFFDAPYSPNSLFIDGYTAFISERATNRLWIIDIESPYEPSIKSYYQFDNPEVRIKHLVHSDSLVYASCGRNGVIIINVNDHENIFETVIYNPEDFVKGIDIEGNYLFTTSLDGKFNIADLSNPLAPNNITTVELNQELWNVKISGDYAYVVGLGREYGGINIFDISNPNHIEEVGFYHVESNGAKEISISGSYAYVLDFDENIQKLDISNPDSVFQIWTFQINYLANNLMVSDGYAYVADGTDGLTVIDVNREQPVLTGYYGTPFDQTKDVYYIDGFTYTVDNSNGFRIYDCSEALNNVEENKSSFSAKQFTINGIFPNPFNTTTLLSYYLPNEGNVILSIYNNIGQKFSVNLIWLPRVIINYY